MMVGLKTLTSMSCPLCLAGSLVLFGCAEQGASKHAEGEALYTTNCKVCHAQGINGAPILGNNKMWAPRAVQGEDTLVEHAMNGFGLMPAKGGKDHLVEEDIRKVVQFMLSELET